MGKAERRKKDSAMAAYMQKHYIVRTTTACPRGHHPVQITNLLNHLTTCKTTARRK
jgi:hypothetical protein